MPKRKATNGSVDVPHSLKVNGASAKVRSLGVAQSMPALTHSKRETRPRLTRSEELDPTSDELPDAIAAAFEPGPASSSSPSAVLQSSATTVDGRPNKKQKRDLEPVEFDDRLDLPADCLAFAVKGSRWWPARVIGFKACYEDDTPRQRPYEVKFGDDETIEWKSRDEFATPYEDETRFRSVPLGEVKVVEGVTAEELEAALKSLEPRLASIVRDAWPSTHEAHDEFMEATPAVRHGLAASADLLSCSQERSDAISAFCSTWLRDYLRAEGKGLPLAQLDGTSQHLYMLSVLLPAIVELLEIEDEETLTIDEPEAILEAHKVARQILDERPQRWAQEILATRHMLAEGSRR